MNVTPFRTRLLAAIQDAKGRHPDAQLHLIYAPELADPLELVNDDRRQRASLIPPSVLTPISWPKEAWPRLITLDCRRIASYLLESDPGLDDPLLEASITQAHAEVCLQGGVNGVVTNDDPGRAENAVCGWVISPESAALIAARINRLSALVRVPQREHVPGQKYKVDRQWIHWYQPENFAALWPTFDTEQRRALLGDAVWLVHTVTGDLQSFAADTPSQSSSSPHSTVSELKVVQWQTLDNVPIVNELTRKWQELCEQSGRRLPKDAAQQLHRHVKAARDHKLDDENLFLFVMTAVQLIPGATDAPEFKEMVQQVVVKDASLREGLRRLPEAFWDRHAWSDDAWEQTPAQAEDKHEVRKARRIIHGSLFNPPDALS